MNKWIAEHCIRTVILVACSSHLVWQVLGLGSMSSIAVSYGENGPVFCGLRSDGSHVASCYGGDSAVIYGAPRRFPFVGLTAGDGFVCGLLLETNQPYCWGNSIYIQMGVPQPMIEGSTYSEISAGDHHICALKKQPYMVKSRENVSLIDCWGYNMTANYVFNGQLESISAGSVFNCGLFSENRTVFCWGDETASNVISLIPKEIRFQKISSGGYHVCGVVEGKDSRVFCWGRSLVLDEAIYVAPSTGEGNNVDLVPKEPMVSVIGGRFHACGIRLSDHGVICSWFQVNKSSPAPSEVKVYELAAEQSFHPVCLGLGFPSSLPMAVSPGICTPYPCSNSCTNEMHQVHANA